MWFHEISDLFDLIKAIAANPWILLLVGFGLVVGVLFFGLHPGFYWLAGVLAALYIIFKILLLPEDSGE